MTVLKKILLLLLVTCTLGYGSAWAYDGHAVNLEGETLLITNQLLPNASDDEHHQNSDHQSSADPICDHCSHISAHTQAIFTQNGYLCGINQSSASQEFSETFISFIISPDRRPPRV